MITLHLPPKTEQAVLYQAAQMGVSVEAYLLEKIQICVQPDVAQFVQGKRLDSFDGDPVAWQQAVRNE